MGRIVKAKQAGDSAPIHEGADAGLSDQAAASVTEILLAARVAADAERVAAKGAAVLLARKMAEKIVGHAIDLDPTVMADIAAQALAASRPRGASVVLRVHPDDVAAVEQLSQTWLAGREAPSLVSLVADPSVGRYGCIVETPVGRIDARLKTQLDVLERLLGGATSRD